MKNLILILLLAFAFNSNAMTISFTNTEDITLDFELYNNYYGGWSFINTYSLNYKQTIIITIEGLGKRQNYGYKVLQCKSDIIQKVASSRVNLYEPYRPIPKYNDR